MLSKFPNKTLKVGAKVSLSPQHQWHRGETNPVGMPGIVDEAGPRFINIGVRWENGRHNIYTKDGYDLIAEGEPGYLETYF